MSSENQSGNQSSAGWALVAFAAMLWGTDLLLRPKLIAAGLSSAVIVLAEHVALSIIFLPLIIAKRNEWSQLERKEWLGLIFVAWAGSAIGTWLLTQAYAAGSPLTATLLQKTQPIFAVLLAAVVLGERRTPLFWLFFVGAMAATYLVSFGPLSPLDALRSPSAPAAAYALGAAALWGSCTVVGRMVLEKLNPGLVAGWRFLLALPLLILMSSPSLSHPGAIHSLTSAPLSYLALIVLLPDVLGMTLYYIGLRTTPASLATLAELAYPMSALILGTLFGHQNLMPAQWIGFVLLIVCLQAIQSTHSIAFLKNAFSRRYTNASPAPSHET